MRISTFGIKGTSGWVSDLPKTPFSGRYIKILVRTQVGVIDTRLTAQSEPSCFRSGDENAGPTTKGWTRNDKEIRKPRAEGMTLAFGGKESVWICGELEFIR
jgi:hypothetical protein